MAHFKFPLILIFILLACGQMEGGGLCIDPLMGSCGPEGECNQRCQAKYPPKVEGKCKLGLCACYYDCNTKTEPGSTCNSNDGVCDVGCDNDCCTARCQGKWPGATGTCTSPFIGTVPSLCLCSFKC